MTIARVRRDVRVSPPRGPPGPRWRRPPRKATRKTPKPARTQKARMTQMNMAAGTLPPGAAGWRADRPDGPEPCPSPAPPLREAHDRRRDRPEVAPAARGRDQGLLLARGARGPHLALLDDVERHRLRRLVGHAAARRAGQFGHGRERPVQRVERAHRADRDVDRAPRGGEALDPAL